jgi:hypothetical protein
VRILEDGAVVIHDSSVKWIEIRSKNEYSSECHKIRLRIEPSINVDIFLGNNSKETVLQNKSYTATSAYLLRSSNQIYNFDIIRNFSRKTSEHDC